MKFKQLNKREEEQVLIEIINELLDDSIPFSGKHRKAQWEKGWRENFKSGDLKPKYFGKYPVTRLNGQLVKGVDEQQALYTIVDKLAKKYLSNASTVVEFGCGTGHNLLRIKKINPKADLWGGDWTTSSNRLVNKLGMKGFKFDFFNPDFTLPDNTAVYTVAALEQVGTEYKRFVSHLIKEQPKIVVHIEPIPELLDSSKLLDYLSIKYMQKRKYLSGYLEYLRQLEKRGCIEILEARRSGIGSKFIDGYSIVIWRPQ